MAKRLTDTDKWKKPFIRSLKSAYKLFWLYILDECDHAGVWQVDFDVAEIKIGEKIKEADALKFLSSKVIPFHEGSKWFIPDFIEFQYPSGLNISNKAHASVIQILSKYGLIDENHKPLASPLQAPTQGAKDMDMDTVKDMDTDTITGLIKNKTNDLVNPFSTAFLVYWQLWKEYKRRELNFRYKTVLTEQAGLKELHEMSEGDEMVAVAMVNKAIAKKWKGFWRLDESELRAIKGSKKSEPSMPDEKHFFSHAAYLEAVQEYEKKQLKAV